MSAIYPLSVHRRIERQWAERIRSLRQIRGLVTATERALQRAFNESPLEGVADLMQLDRSQPRD